MRRDGSYLLRNFDGKQIRSTHEAIASFLENNFFRLGTYPLWINPERVLVSVWSGSALKIQSRFSQANYAVPATIQTPQFFSRSELTEINPTTAIRLTAASQISPLGSLNICNKSYPISASLRADIVRKVKALGWLKLKNGTLVNPQDFAVMVDDPDGWVNLEFGRTLRMRHFSPEDVARLKTVTPWVQVQGRFVNPSKILYLDPENLVVQCDDHSLGFDEKQFAVLKKLVDPRIVHPLHYH